MSNFFFFVLRFHAHQEITWLPINPLKFLPFIFFCYKIPDQFAPDLKRSMQKNKNYWISTIYSKFSLTHSR